MRNELECLKVAYEARREAMHAEMAEEEWVWQLIERHAPAPAPDDDPERVRLHALTVQAAESRALAEQRVGGRVYRVPAINVDTLLKRVAKLVKRAIKLDVEPPKVTDATREIIPTRRNNVEVAEEFHYLVITGTAPRIGGWQFVAVLEHTGARTIIRRVPRHRDEQQLDLATYRTATARCEHCGLARRRADTYLVISDDGEIKQVGSSCLADFTGHQSPDQYAGFAELLVDLDQLAVGSERDDDCEPGVGGGPILFGARDFLTYVAQSIRLYGWTPRSGYGEPTSDAAAGRLLAAMRGQRENSDPKPEPADAESATKTLEWVRDTLGARDWLSDFEHNLLVVLSADWLPQRRLGIAAAAINAYRCAIEREIERTIVAQADPGHLGKPGERIEVEVTVTATHYSDGRWGTTSIYKLLDADGRHLTWFSSRDMLDQGARYRLRVTIREHSEFNGISETVLTRCTVLDQLAEATTAV